MLTSNFTILPLVEVSVKSGEGQEAIRLLEENHPKGKVAVAITLGLCTLVRWQRIVVMVGETIGKSYFIYQPGPPQSL